MQPLLVFTDALLDLISRAAVPIHQWQCHIGACVNQPRGSNDCGILVTLHVRALLNQIELDRPFNDFQDLRQRCPDFGHHYQAAWQSFRQTLFEQLSNYF